MPAFQNKKRLFFHALFSSSILVFLMFLGLVVPLKTATPEPLNPPLGFRDMTPDKAS